MLACHTLHLRSQTIDLRVILRAQMLQLLEQALDDLRLVSRVSLVLLVDFP